MNNPLISFCFATANRPGDLFNSLLALKNEIAILPSLYEAVKFEVIINDSSTPSCVFPESCLKQIFNHKNVFFSSFCSPLNGVDAAYELLADYSRGKYLWLMSDDDQIIKSKLSNVISILLNCKPTVFVVNSVLASYNLSRDYGFALFSPRICSAVPVKYDHHNIGQLYDFIQYAPSFISFALVSRDHWNINAPYSSVGTEFSHVTRIFGNITDSFTCLVDNQPYLRLRMNNNQWRERAILIWLVNWPYVLNKCAGISHSTVKLLSYDRSFFALFSKSLLFRSSGLLNYPFLTFNHWGSLSRLATFVFRMVCWFIPKKLAFFLVALCAFNSKPWIVIDSCK